jgi:Fe2+ or Zn2+ uptake regulation protein
MGTSASLANSLLASDLGSSTDEEQQISQLVQTAQSNGTSASDLLAQIENAIDTSQPTQLYQYLDGSSTSAYTSNGEATTSTTSSLVNTSA